jgi:hypothetical protein
MLPTGLVILTKHITFLCTSSDANMGRFELTVAPLLLTMDLFTPPANAPDFFAIYPNAIEEIDSCLLIPKGHELKITAIVDADHAHNRKSRRSITGIILLVGHTPVVWIRK